MASEDNQNAPDLDSSNMDLESSNDSIDVTQTSPLNNILPSKPSNPSNYPKARKPPPPPTSAPPAVKTRPKRHSRAPVTGPPAAGQANNNKPNDNDDEKKEAPRSTSGSISTSAWNVLSSARSSISRGAKSVSTKTSERMSLNGQLKQARVSLEKFVTPKFIQKDKSIPRWVLKGAKGVVFLTVLKAGFLIGGQGGTGCVIVRRPDGKWSGPSSIAVGGLSAGFLAGASKIDYIMILPNDNAVSQFTGKGQLRLGGDLTLAVGPLGRDASGSVGGGDEGWSVIYSYSHAAGLYGGLGLDGKIISVRPKCNEEFYGKAMSVKEILLGNVDPKSIQNEDFQSIVHLLDSYCNADADDKKQNDKPDANMKQTAVFGRDVAALECTKLKGYKSPIPNVLITLKEALYKHEGHLVEGIFRRETQKSKLKEVKDTIDNGKLYEIDFGEIPPILIAQLIKVWFRECPESLLDNIDATAIEQAETVSDAQQIIETMQEPALSYFYWLLDLCIELAKYSDRNLMTHNNLAVVFAPNMYDMANVKSMSFSGSVVQFMSLCIEYRVEMSHIEQANKIMDQIFDDNSNEPQTESTDQILTPSKPDTPL